MQTQAWKHGGLGGLGSYHKGINAKIIDNRWSALADVVYFIGRICFGLVFVMYGATHFSADTIQYAASQGVPYAIITVPVAGVIAIAGALLVMSGIGTRFGALLLILFLVPVTLIMHAFWTYTDPHMAMLQRVMFFKNLSILGATIIIALNGAGQRRLGIKA